MDNNMLNWRDGEHEEWKPRRVGGLLRSLGFEPKRRNDGYSVEVNTERVVQLVKEYGLDEPKGDSETKNEGKVENPVSPPTEPATAGAVLEPSSNVRTVNL